MRREVYVIAFEDAELNDWLIQAIDEGPGQFLPALAEAVVTASPEDYSLVRPALMSLKQRYCFVSATTIAKTTRSRSVGSANPASV